MRQLPLKSFAWSIALISLAAMSYCFGTALLFLGTSANIQSTFQLSMAICMPIGFVVFPYLLVGERLKKHAKQEIVFDWKCYLVLALAIFIINVVFIKSDEFFLQMTVSMCEEVLFRYIIYLLLRKECSPLVSVLLSSILFGFILHMNYPVMENLMLRVPLGIALSFIAKRFGLHYAIASHWLYNLLVSTI